MASDGRPQRDAREANLRVLRDCLAAGPMAQVELAAVSKLSEATVSNLVRILVEQGHVHVEPGIRNGRRTRILSLRDRPAPWYLGIEIARTRVRVAAVGHGADPAVHAAEIPVPCAYSQALDTVVELVRGLDEGRGLSPARLAGAVVAVPGLVRATSEGAAPDLLGEGYHQAMGWGSVPLTRDLAEALGTEVTVENDCNLAALAEMHAGAGRGHRDFMYVLGHAYVGGGLVLNGRIYRGGGGVAGEFGHTVVDSGGKSCWCGGRGCLETVVGEAALVEAAGEGRVGRPRDLAQVVSGALAGDARCRAAITDAGTAIGSVIGAVATPLDLRLAVIGGPLTGAGRLLLDAVRARLTAYVGQLHPSTTAVAIAELGDEAPVRGAALAAARQAAAPG
ncbi:ROK family transcriptional regulator [Yinghuangia soli]|uniref:ROK family transcriptional regulator n=1 Tax=Yinghuangia soli TaxID=2908204 RepID=A0AA41Q5S2_9ACTN|nr:ROK family transcriptional regulator [Yinghuangia soli]MCF2530889.1 ROK family transcriptional regulator [Yinghuangia soli]